MVYDDVRNITWLQDWNSNGLMSWSAANIWANSLIHGGFDDWRLPTALNPDSSPPCLGMDCMSSEFGYMLYVNLGDRALESVLNQTGDTDLQKANLALLSNVQAYVYWLGTEDATNPNRAAYFATDFGFQGLYGNKDGLQHAVAVRNGDVAAPVPEPETLALALLALGVGVVARRR